MVGTLVVVALLVGIAVATARSRHAYVEQRRAWRRHYLTATRSPEPSNVTILGAAPPTPRGRPVDWQRLGWSPDEPVIHPPGSDGQADPPHDQPDHRLSHRGTSSR